jgi:hypothetical protein
MAITAKQVFDQALALMDEVTEVGSITTEQPEYYKVKALKFLTILQTELLPTTIDPFQFTDLSQEMLVDDKVALMVLPYGLAAHLLLADDMNLAAFYNARYDELKRRMPTINSQITNVFSILGGMQ